MKRRTFIQSSCGACLLGTAAFLLPQLAGCKPAYTLLKADIINGQIQLPLSAFGTIGILLLRPKGWFFNIAIQKTKNGYEALLLQCTHQRNQLQPTGNGYHCSLHGSQFDKNGFVTKGPAETPLKKYRCTVVGDQFIITIKEFIN